MLIRSPPPRKPRALFDADAALADDRRPGGALAASAANLFGAWTARFEAVAVQRGAASGSASATRIAALMRATAPVRCAARREHAIPGRHVEAGQAGFSRRSGCPASGASARDAGWRARAACLRAPGSARRPRSRRRNRHGRPAGPSRRARRRGNARRSSRCPRCGRRAARPDAVRRRCRWCRRTGALARPSPRRPARPRSARGGPSAAPGC